MLPDSIESTLDHIDRIATKRELLTKTIEDSFAALLCAVERGRDTLTVDDVMELYYSCQDLAGPRRPLSSTTARLAAALHMPLNRLVQWANHPESRPKHALGETSVRGTFPLWHQWVPERGAPCVYVLLANDVVVYIGRSEHVAARLRTHWKEKPGVDRWIVHRCSDFAASVSLERRLIERYSPRFNRVGNRYQNV